MITFTPATVAHGQFVASHIRDLDREELRLTGARDPHRAIYGAIELSMGNAIAALDDGSPIAVLGMAPNYLIGEGMPWMLGTDAVARHPRELILWSRRMVEHWLTELPILMNEVWIGNTPAVRYLKHVGFEFAEPRINEYGAEMAVFYKRRS